MVWLLHWFKAMVSRFLQLPMSVPQIICTCRAKVTESPASVNWRSFFVSLWNCGQTFLSSILSGQFCGTTLPDPIQTNGNRLLIRFHTDLLTEAKGFRAYWTTNPSLPAPTEPPVQPNPWDNIIIGGVSAPAPHSLLQAPRLHRWSCIDPHFSTKINQLICVELINNMFIPISYTRPVVVHCFRFPVR